MIQSLSTLLIVVAGLLVMISGAFPAPSDTLVRTTACRLVLAAVGLLLLPRIWAGIPTRYVVLLLVFASLAAFVALEYRQRERHQRVHTFVNYRTSGKKLIEDDEPPIAQERDDDDRHEYL